MRRGNPPVLPPVIPSERSESRDLACSFTFQLRSVRRSFDSLRSLRMTAWVEGWELGGKPKGLPRQESELARNDSISFQTPICRFFFLLSFPEIRENIRFTFWENLSIMERRMQYFQPGGADIFFAKRHINCPLSTVNCQLSHRGAIYDRAIQNSQFFHHRPH